MSPGSPNAKELFVAAVRMAPDQRESYLRQACGEDEGLRRRVTDLLAAHFEAASFLDSPVTAILGTVDPDHVTEGPGTVIGPYKLLEQIGEGGFGVVFMAEQQQPVRRRVAVKILKPGMDTRQVVARFEAERQALAIMDHPNIARVFDGGATASGRPFFVMELVKGAPITEHCDQNHLTPRERLQLFVSVCHAVQHAHQKGIIHRDLKPSNVLVSLHDTIPVVKVIDFGVAKALGQELTDKTLFTGFAQMIGTPLYMSPEQAGQSSLDADTRSDIYSLGVLLYELLTGTTPFDKERFKRAAYDEIRRIIREEDPPKPSTRLSELSHGGPVAAHSSIASIAALRRSDPGALTRLLRGELDWIVMTCLEKDRARRYETANGLALDIQRYLADEPVQACPPTAGYRFWKFVRRHKRGASVVAVAVLAAVSLAGGRISLERARTDAARERAAHAEDSRKKERRDALVQQLEQICLTAHQPGWMDRAWERAGQAATIHRDIRLLNHAAATLIGTDVRMVKRFDELGASSLAFDRDGKRLLMGGLTDRESRPVEPAKIWDAESDLLYRSQQSGSGPVAFRSDRTALQFVLGGQDGLSLLLWDVTEQQLVQEFKLPASGKLETGTVRAESVLGLSPDGSFAAASLIRTSGKAMLAVWDTSSGKLVRVLDKQATAIGLSPVDELGHGLLAAGDDRGVVLVWSLPEGELVATLPAGKSRINCLALARSPQRSIPDRSGTADQGWMLAAGDAGGNAIVWDVDTQLRRNFVRGLGHGVNALAFSPDGSTLAVSARDYTQIRDAATDRVLLDNLVSGQFITGLTFSPDGRRLAVSSHSLTSAGKVCVWDLENGRGMRTLRGLAGPVQKICISSDSRLVAGLSHDWRVAIWDRQTGQLLHVFDVPSGRYADNSALAFDADGQRFAFAAGTNATLWEVASGQVLGSWVVPPGLGELLAFHPTGKLLLFHFETTDMQHWPNSRVPPADHPRICRVRDLLAPDPASPLFELHDFNWHLFTAVMAPDGSCLAIEGLGGPAGKDRTLKAYEGTTGKELWSLPLSTTSHSSTVLTDPAGQILGFHPSEGGPMTLLELTTGKRLGSLAGLPGALSPGATYWTRNNDDCPPGFDLVSQSDGNTLVTLGIYTPSTDCLKRFDAGGEYLAWGTPDGEVIVADLREIQNRLKNIE